MGSRAFYSDDYIYDYDGGLNAEEKQTRREAAEFVVRGGVITGPSGAWKRVR